MRARELPSSGLRLGVLEALLGLGHLEEQALRDRLADVRDPDAEDDYEAQDEWITEALTRLAEVEIDAAQLGEIEQLDFDGGNDIYMLIEETLDIDTGGETDHYQVESLAGIERLSGLRVLNLDGHGYRRTALDLSPLRGLEALERVVLSGTCTGAAVLESLPALAEIDLRLGSVDDEAVLERLVARGVVVRLR